MISIAAKSNQPRAIDDASAEVGDEQSAASENAASEAVVECDASASLSVQGNANAAPPAAGAAVAAAPTTEIERRSHVSICIASHAEKVVEVERGNTLLWCIL